MIVKLLPNILCLALLAGGCQTKAVDKTPQTNAAPTTEARAPDAATGPELSAWLLERIATRLDKAAEDPKFTKAIEGLIEQASRHPALLPAGEAFFSRLGNDPAMLGPAKAFVDKLATSQTMQQFVLRIASQNPGLKPEQLEKRVGEKVDQILSGPIWEQAIERAVDRLMKHPQMNAAFERLGKKMLSGAKFETDLSRVMGTLLGNTAVSARLTALNDGRPVTGAGDLQLLADRVLTEARLLDLTIRFCGMKNLSDRLGEQLAKLVNTPAFARNMAPNLARIISDPVVEQKTLHLFDVLLANQIDPGTLDKTLRQVFEQPVVHRELSDIIDGCATNQVFKADIRTTLLAAFNSPEFITVLMQSLQT